MQWIAAALTLPLAVVLLLVARGLRRVSASREQLVASFAGGVSLAFVMVELFVELAEGAVDELHELVRAGPDPIHTVAMLILAGTVLAVVAEAHGSRCTERRAYRVSVVPVVIYGMLVGAALVEELQESALSFGAFWLAMALHLGVTQHRLEATFQEEHAGVGRVCTAASPAVGAVVWAAVLPPITVFHVLLALVAGSTILSIFRDEIPSARSLNARAFVVGIVLFVALAQARWWL